MSDFFAARLKEAAETLQTALTDPELMTTAAQCVEELTQVLGGNGRVFSCGNGGSMCDAMHFAEELTGRYRKDRSPLAAMAISDPAHLSCVANDYGYEAVFARMVEAFGQKGDILVAISTSGNSANILKACEAAQARGMKVMGLTGFGGGQLADVCDYSLCVPGPTTDRVQEMHIKFLHILIEGVERNLFPANYC